MFRQLKAFITGSHAYGSPTSSSDLDLVVYTDRGTMAKVAEVLGVSFREAGSYSNPRDESLNVKEGRLNLILVSTKKEYRLWYRVTNQLKKYSLVTREIAVWHFKKARGLVNKPRAWSIEMGELL